MTTLLTYEDQQTLQTAVNTFFNVLMERCVRIEDLYRAQTKGLFQRVDHQQFFDCWSQLRDSATKQCEIFKELATKYDDPLAHNGVGGCSNLVIYADYTANIMYALKRKHSKRPPRSSMLHSMYERYTHAEYVKDLEIQENFRNCFWTAVKDFSLYYQEYTDRRVQ